MPAQEKRTPRQFECTRLVTVDHVKAVIARVPGFGESRPTEEKSQNDCGTRSATRTATKSDDIGHVTLSLDEIPIFWPALVESPSYSYSYQSFIGCDPDITSTP